MPSQTKVRGKVAGPGPSENKAGRLPGADHKGQGLKPKRKNFIWKLLLKEKERLRITAHRFRTSTTKKYLKGSSVLLEGGGWVGWWGVGGGGGGGGGVFCFLFFVFGLGFGGGLGFFCVLGVVWFCFLLFLLGVVGQGGVFLVWWFGGLLFLFFGLVSWGGAISLILDLKRGTTATYLRDSAARPVGQKKCAAAPKGGKGRVYIRGKIRHLP